MANNDQSEEPKENEQPEQEPAEGLTAEQAAEQRPYDEMEVWKKSKNTLFSVLGAIALAVAISSFYNNSQEEEAAERSLRFLNASVSEVGSEEKFLSFAEDYEDTLGGVAQYRAASLQYGDERFSEAATNFLEAANRLAGDPLRGRAKIGHAVSLIKDGKKEEGKSALLDITKDNKLLKSDQFEARYLLGVHALSNDKRDEFEAQFKALGEDERSADYLSSLADFERLYGLVQTGEVIARIKPGEGC